MTWYSSIEDEIIRRERWEHHRDYLTGVEQAVLNAEQAALEKPYSTYLDELRYDYYDSGVRIQCKEIITVQAIEWIGEFIQKRLASQRIHMEYKQILAMLSRITTVYYAAEIKHNATPSLQLSEFKRDDKAA